MRSQTIESRFADAKEQHGMSWTKYTGIQKVTMETTLIFACINLKKNRQTQNDLRVCLRSERSRPVSAPF
ncbi:transposase [Macrococcus armenti]|uniref:transposase n=1 Tax=Macrococcus armenti TaxID=2875764 RepID=UPI003B96A223